MGMILAAVVVVITLAVSILIIYNVLASIGVSSVDATLETTFGENVQPATNATQSIISNVNTFYSIAPIAVIVIAAVGILSYVMLIGGRRE